MVININIADEDDDYDDDDENHELIRYLTNEPFNFEPKIFNHDSKTGLSTFLLNDCRKDLFDENMKLKYDSIICIINGCDMDDAVELDDDENDDTKYDDYNDLREIFNVSKLSRIPKIYLIGGGEENNQLTKKSSPQDFSVTFHCNIRDFMQTLKENYEQNTNKDNYESKELFKILDIDVDIDRKFIIRGIQQNQYF